MVSFLAARSRASGAVGGMTPERPLVGAGTSTTALGGSSMAVAAGSFAGSANAARGVGPGNAPNAAPLGGARAPLPREAPTDGPRTETRRPLAQRELKG